METFDIIRQVPVGAAAHTLGVAHHRNPKRTNPEKTWQRYAGALVLEGDGVYHDWRGRSHAIAPGCLVHHLPGRWHDIQRGAGGWMECVLSADSATCRRWIGLGVIDEERPVQPLGDPRPAVEGFLQLRRLLRAENAASWRQALVETEQLLLSCWERGSDQRARGDGALALDTAAARLAADHAGRLGLEATAAACGLGYVVFRRRFKERFGCSPGAWRNRHRLEHAALVLAHRRVALADLAAELGYADQFVFSRRFKDHHGRSPSEHRRRHFSE
jgi:AraC-like DNA-binding protein